MSSKAALLFLFLSAVNESSRCSASSPALGVVSVLEFGHSNSCAVALLFFFFLILFIYLFIFGCVGSSLLRLGFSLVAASGGYSLLWCTGFSLRWLLLLQTMGSRRAGFSSRGARA